MTNPQPSIPKKRGTNFPMIVNVPEAKESSVLDGILTRLIADVDDNVEFVGTIFNPKSTAKKKVIASLNKAKSEILKHYIPRREVEETLNIEIDMSKVAYQEDRQPQFYAGGWNAAINEIRKRLGIEP